MTNFWLTKKLRREIRLHLRSYIISCLKIGPDQIFALSGAYLNKCTDYALRMIDNYGYDSGIQEMENIIKHTAAIDRKRFFVQ